MKDATVYTGIQIKVCHKTRYKYGYIIYIYIIIYISYIYDIYIYIIYIYIHAIFAIYFDELYIS